MSYSLEEVNKLTGCEWQLSWGKTYIIHILQTRNNKISIRYEFYKDVFVYEDDCDFSYTQTGHQLNIKILTLKEVNKKLKKIKLSNFS